MGGGARRIVAGLRACGVGTAVTVPDSWIGHLQEAIAADGVIRDVAACREEEAVAIACGVNLAGGRAAVLMQNAGLLACSGILASLVEPHRIPLLMVVSYRGDARDPIFYHIPKGRHTEPLLRAMGIPYALADRGRDLAEQVAEGFRQAEEAGSAFAFLFSSEDLV